MKKIPTLFKRDEGNRKYVTLEYAVILPPHVLATQKLDGVCVAHFNGDWWFRREVNPQKHEPDGWVGVDKDEGTGKRVGWEPAKNSGFYLYLREALDEDDSLVDDIADSDEDTPLTYELLGPKINGNPHGEGDHWLYPHGRFELSDVPDGEDPEEIQRFVRSLPKEIEGIVWWHDCKPVAKLKRRDIAPYASKEWS